MAKVTEENCLANANPSLAKQWHPTKNENLTPYDVGGKSGKKVWWKCEKGHEWKANISNRSRLGRGCPYCSGQKLSIENSLAIISPKIALEWDHDKNQLTPYDVSPKSRLKVWWKCSFDHLYLVRIDHKVNGQDCPYCSGKRACLENCLATLRPDITKQWDSTLNGELTPYDITPFSARSVWWNCDSGHSFKAKVCKRTNRGDGCPYCYGRYPTEGNNLAVTHPEFASQWHPTKNGNLTPKDVLASGSQNVWWLGSCGHEWEATINGRKYGKIGCPYCSAQKICLDNCLATLNPKIASEWHPELNGKLTPYDVTVCSSVEVWWLCTNKECNHAWRVRVASRKNGTGCPKCGLHRSIGEEKIEEILNLNNVINSKQYTFNDCKHIHTLPFDHAIFDDYMNLKCLIEFDGIQHFKPVEYWNGEEGFKKQQTRDKIKNEYCKENNIPLIRIPYWEFDNIESILNNELIKLNLID